MNLEKENKAKRKLTMLAFIQLAITNDIAKDVLKNMELDN